MTQIIIMHSLQLLFANNAILNIYPPSINSIFRISYICVPGSSHRCSHKNGVVVTIRVLESIRISVVIQGEALKKNTWLNSYI